MKYVRYGKQIAIDKGLTDGRDLFDRLRRELDERRGLRPRFRIGRNRALLLTFDTVYSAVDAEEWIEEYFEV